MNDILKDRAKHIFLLRQQQIYNTYFLFKCVLFFKEVTVREGGKLVKNPGTITKVNELWYKNLYVTSCKVCKWRG